jgi:uncharacterized protein (TIGR02646 family)
MIRLAKTPEPKLLEDNAATWTKELMEALKNEEEPSRYLVERYRHKDIKDALLNETHEKCAYCESKFRHVTYGDVEHITPRDEDPALSFQWQNLTVACDVCNTNKGAVAAGTIVDPYTDDPNEFFRFAGSMVLAIIGIDKADATTRMLKLNRPALLENRATRLQNIGNQLNNILKTVNQDHKRILMQDFIANELADVAEYSAIVRSYFQSESANSPELQLADD